MVEHFRGVAEAFMKSCAKEASLDPGDTQLNILKSKEEMRRNGGSGRRDISSLANGDSEMMEEGDEQEESSSEEQVNENHDDLDLTSSGNDGEDCSWNFASSIVFHRPVHDELGTTKSKVNAREIVGDLDSCLRTADYVANEAIVSNISEFEKYCRRNMQLRNRSLKVNAVKERVTGQSLATIPTIFATSFTTLLKNEIRELYSHELKSEFFQGVLDELLAHVMYAANTLFRRNGQVFLDIAHQAKADQLFLDENREDISDKKKKAACQAVDEENLVEQASRSTASPLAGRSMEVISCGLGFHTDMSLGIPAHQSALDVELLILLLYIFQDCCSRHLGGMSFMGSEEIDEARKSATFEEHFSDIRKKCIKALEELQGSDARPWWDAGSSYTLRHQIKLLKLNILRRISKVMINPGALLLLNSLFCYEIPVTDESKSNTEQKVLCGRSLTIFHGGGQGIEDVVWNMKVYEISSRSMDDNQAEIFRANPYAFLGDLCVNRTRVPNIKVVSLKAEVQCNTDVWNEVDFDVKGQQYLGLSRFDPVKLILAIRGSSERIPSDPLHGDYHHCFIGFVFSDPTPIGDAGPQKGSTPADIERIHCIGPMKCQFEVLIHDNLPLSSGAATCISTFVERWNETKGSERSCYVEPVEGITLREEASQYYALKDCSLTPQVFKLAMVNLRMAESYELERRKRHHQLMQYVIAEDPFQRQRFRSMQRLENEHKEMLHSVISMFDRELSASQLEAIQKTLYGWRSDNSPNGSRILEHMIEDMKEMLRSSGTVSKNDLTWWGSNICILDGPPRSGKSRTIAVLICLIMESMTIPSSLYGYKVKPRALVVTVSDSSLDELFCAVCKTLQSFFGQNKRRYKQALNKMVCVSYHSTKELVRSRQASNLTTSKRASSVVDIASVVFATSSSLNRQEFFTDVPFSLLVVEEAEFLGDAGLIEAVSLAFVRYENGEDFQRAAILISGSHSGRESFRPDLMNTTRNFFCRSRDTNNSCCFTTKATLTQQYELQCAMRNFFDKIFNEGNEVVNCSERDATITEQYVKDNMLKSLWTSKNYPIRNIMVIDTSLDKKDAFETSVSNCEKLNRWEASTIRYLLSRWASIDTIDPASLQKRVTVICAYARQRIEISRQLINEGLSKVQVRTLDQVMGVSNDIIILSLVASSSEDSNLNAQEIFPPASNSPSWMKLAWYRAKYALIVVCYGKHFCEQNSCWAPFLKKCLQESDENSNGTYGYYRPRYVAGKQDFRLAKFAPQYALL